MLQNVIIEIKYAFYGNIFVLTHDFEMNDIQTNDTDGTLIICYNNLSME